jgi:hypothetical protein
MISEEINEIVSVISLQLESTSLDFELLSLRVRSGNLVGSERKRAVVAAMQAALLKKALGDTRRTVLVGYFKDLLNTRRLLN